MTQFDIDHVIVGFVDTARRGAIEAGFDGIEIHGNHDNASHFDAHRNVAA